MDYRKIQNAKREGMRDYPSETDIDYEDENLEDTNFKLNESESEELKKLGRQTEV